VLLRNDLDGRNALKDTVVTYFERCGGRVVACFLESKNEEWGWAYQHFILERKHIFRYGLGDDRHLSIGGLELAIGPHYFGPAIFWDYSNAQRFKMEASTDAVEHNLRLLDEFLGYPVSWPS